MRVEVVVSAL